MKQRSSASSGGTPAIWHAWRSWLTDTSADQPWKSKFALLVLMSVGMTLGFTLWRTLLDNFAIEQVGYTGVEIGWLQGLREVPGFLAFTTVFALLIMREQVFGLVMLLVMGIGVALTGYLPTVYGLYFITVLMSIGFHYYETVHQSLSLQWLPKATAPALLGRILSVKSIINIITLGAIGLAFAVFEVDFIWMYLVGGGLVMAIALYCWLGFAVFEEKVPQRKELILRRRYWLYYALTFMSGARRQIFIVFAGFMLVEKFGFSVFHIAGLYLANEVFTAWFAPKIGRIINRIGERSALVFEYVGLIIVFASYAFVSTAWLAGTLYIIDHLFFAFAIAIKTYFQKIGDPEDMASTAGVAFTINHIAAVFLPVLLGYIWIVSNAAVFLLGAGFAVISLILALMVPRDPRKGQETIALAIRPQAVRA